MSGKKNQGTGAATPAPEPETLQAPLDPAPVAADTVTAETPAGILPAEPFEPPLPIPAAEPKPLQEQQAQLAADRDAFESERGEFEKQREALVAAVDKLEKDREAFESDREAEKAPKAKRQPRLIDVKAVRGVIDPLRAQHREPGEVFRMYEDQAELLEDRGEVEIL